MVVTEDSVRRLTGDYPGMTIVARQGVLGPVMAVRVRVAGVRGGHSSVECWYELIIDTSDLHRAIPPVWVSSPPDRQIKHVNIWPEHKSFCRFAGKNLPSFCWNTFANGWSKAPLRSRTLSNALEYAKQLLSTENHDSPAR